MGVRQHNRLLARGRKRALELEQPLADVVRPILARAGVQAARRFEEHATDFLTASAYRDADDARIAAMTPAEARGVASSLALTAAAIASTSTMVAVYPRPEEAATLALEDDPDGEEAGILHVTLAYLGDTDDETLAAAREALAPVAASYAPLIGKVGGVGTFGAEEHAGGTLRGPSILLPDVPGLVELRVAVTEALVRAGIDYSRDHGFQPHITLAYTEGSQTPPDDRIGQPLHFDNLCVVRGDVPVEMPLVGPPALTAAAKSDSDDPIVRELVRVADELDAAKPDYGDTAWNAETGTVRWVPADYTTDDGYEEAEAAFLAVDGVRAFEAIDAEACLCCDPDDGWELVYGGDCCSEGGLGLTAAGAAGEPPMWSAPDPAELLDTDDLTRRLRGKTDPVRLAVAETLMTPALEGAGLAFDVENPFTAKVLQQSASQIQEIAETTRGNVMAIIHSAYQDGLSIPDTAAAIRSGMTEASVARSELIARTELAGVVNGGSLAAVEIVTEATGETLYKRWLTAEGAPNARHEEYEGLDGQTVDLDAYFDVGGIQLEFPGDPGGPPDEICNCRCTVIYVESLDAE